MKKFLWAVIPCAAAVIVFLIYLNLGSNGSQQLSLWYVAGDVSPSAMESLALEYNDHRGRDSYALSLQSFPSEEELASAFEYERPDLLLCSYTRAADLGNRGLLGAVELADRDYLPAIEDALPFAGRSFFPLGSAVPMLVFDSSMLNEAGISPDFGSFERFLESAAEYRQKTGAPFFSAESLSPLLCTCCASLGYELKGEPELDGMNEDFAGTYNALASAALEGSFLPPGESRLEMVAAGLLPCVLLDRPSGIQLPEGLDYGPLPLPESGQAVYVPDIMGFAVTGANSYALASVRDFLLWMQEDFSYRDTLALGLVPVTAQLKTEEATLPLEQLLLDTYHQEAIVYPPLGNFCEKRQEMENELCRALDLLY